MKDLAGGVAVVTGAASGMGRAVARRLAAESMRVVAADIEEPPLRETVRLIRADGGDAIAVVCDVSSAQSVEELRDAARAAYGSVDVLFNNAGVVASGSVIELSLKSWEWCLGVNLWGVIHGLRTFVPEMVKRGRGHVVNTASILGHLTAPSTGPYTVSKHGVVALSETLRDEMIVSETGVGVTCLCPGVVATNILESERNRPEHYMDDVETSILGLGRDTEEAELIRQAMRDRFRSGLNPDVVAEMVLDAIVTNRFWLFTDEEFDEQIATRHRKIEAKDPGTAASGFTGLLDTSALTSG